MGNLEDSIQSALPVIQEESFSYNHSFESGDTSDYSDSDEEYFEQKIFPSVKRFENLGVTVTFHEMDSPNMDKLLIRRCLMEERNELVEEIMQLENQLFGCDIFKSENPTFEWKEEARVSVNLHEKITKRHKVTALLKVKAQWIRKDAIFDNGCAVFKTKLTNIEYFVIVYDLEEKVLTVPPEGARMKVYEDSKLELDIPSGAVETVQDLRIQVKPPDRSAMKKKNKHGQKPDCESIVGLTECIYTKNPSLKFKKPITVKLPFEGRQDKADDTTVVAFQMDSNKEIHMIDPKNEVTVDEEGVCSIEVQDLKGTCAAVVKSNALENRHKLEKEIEMNLGFRYPAKILIFKEKKKMSGFPRIWIELVKKDSVRSVVKTRTQEDKLIELPNSRSPDVTVYEGFRLRIDIDRGLQRVREIPRNFYFITYMSVAQDHHRLFPVQRSVHSPTSMGRFSFSSDKGTIHCIHAIEVDTVGSFDKVYRTDGVESQRETVPTRTEQIGREFPSDLCSDQQPHGLPENLQPLCPALNDNSLSRMADMMKNDDDGWRLCAHLKMSNEFDVMWTRHANKRDAVFELLKKWTGKHAEDVQTLIQALTSAGFSKIAKLLKKAAKKNKEFNPSRLSSFFM